MLKKNGSSKLNEVVLWQWFPDPIGRHKPVYSGYTRRFNFVYHPSLTSKLPLFNFFVPTGRWQELYSPLRATLARALPFCPPKIFPSIFSWFAPLPLFSPQDWLPLVLQDIQWVEGRAGVCSTGKCRLWAGNCGFLEQVLRHLSSCPSKLKVQGSGDEWSWFALSTQLRQQFLWQSCASQHQHWHYSLYIFGFEEFYT